MRFSQVRLLVDDFQGYFAFLRDSLGLECTFGGRVVYVRDPDGNLFELFQSIPMEEE